MKFYNNYAETFPNKLQQTHYDQGVKVIKKVGLKVIEKDLEGFSNAYGGAIEMLDEPGHPGHDSIKVVLAKTIMEGSREDILNTDAKIIKKKLLNDMSIEQSKEIFLKAVNKFKKINKKNWE